MRKIKIFMVLVLLVAGVSGAWAQSYVYKGVTAEQARSNSSETYYLYNVGTGTFLYIGSSWGTKGSLLYSDLGLPVTVGKIYNTNYYSFKTPLGGQDEDPNGYFGMVHETDASNTPGLYGDRSGFTAEGHKFRYNHHWTLEPAEAPDGVTQYYLRNRGCASWHGDEAKAYTYIYGDNESLGEVKYSATRENSSFYKWSIVSRTEILSVINSELAESFGGLNASLTFLIDNQGFYCKNNGKWQINGLSFNNRNTDYGKQASLVGDANNNTDQLNFGKYYHANISFSGTSTTEGWLYQVIDAPKAGLYHVYCQGFDSAGDGAEFIAVSGSSTPTLMKSYDYSNPAYSKVNLKKAADGLTATSSIYVDDYQVYQNGAWVTSPQDLTRNNLAAGVAFYKNEYTNDLFVYVPNDNGKITIAIHKTNRNSYTAVDDFHVVYLGASIFVFDENETDGVKTLNGGESTVASELVAARNMGDIQTMGTATVLMKRSMSVNNWNTLVLPFSLSATAFKRAFGETAQLATCDGLDESNPNIIKFISRSLASDEGIVVEKGKFYLVKPALKPSQLDQAIAYVNYDGTPKTIGAGTEYYNLSRQDLSGGSTDGRDWSDDNKTAFKTPESELYTAANHNSIQLKGTYYLRDNFEGDDQRLYSDSRENQKYVFGHKNDTYAMWRLGTTRRAIKGTRWWIEDVYGSGGAKDMMLLSFNGVVDGDETLAIDMEEGFTPVVRMDNKVYNLNGQVVNATLESLPRGIYVVNGKKYVVK